MTKMPDARWVLSTFCSHSTAAMADPRRLASLNRTGATNIDWNPVIPNGEQIII
jgi:hypothetical protein